MNAIPNIKPLFEIDNPNREPKEVSTAWVFDWLEESGWRVCLGGVLVNLLGWIVFALRVVADIPLCEFLQASNRVATGAS